MKFELSQHFYFESAHTLSRDIESESSKRIHGHTYYAEVTISGEPNVQSGMIIDLAYLREKISIVRERLDHHFLDEIEDLGKPTLENLCMFIYKNLIIFNLKIKKISISRKASGDKCTLKIQG